MGKRFAGASQKDVKALFLVPALKSSAGFRMAASVRDGDGRHLRTLRQPPWGGQSTLASLRDRLLDWPLKRTR